MITKFQAIIAISIWLVVVILIIVTVGYLVKIDRERRENLRRREDKR